MNDTPMTLTEAVEHYKGRMSDPQKVAILRTAIEELFAHTRDGGRGSIYLRDTDDSREALEQLRLTYKATV